MSAHCALIGRLLEDFLLEACDPASLLARADPRSVDGLRGFIYGDQERLKTAARFAHAYRQAVASGWLRVAPGGHGKILEAPSEAVLSGKGRTQ